MLLAYSDIAAVDLERISEMRFQNQHTIKMESVTVGMIKAIKKIRGKHVFIFQTQIATNKVGNFSMEDIRTHHRQEIWMKYLNKFKDMQKKTTTCQPELSEKDLCELIKGTKLHHQITHCQDFMDSE